jgi:predicted adenine nucleotide alpha hydrolase (AANH) superfamily ATPase
MKVLLHICCGVCGAGVVERLQEEGYYVEGFFYNPNIQPMEEYERRLGVARTVARELDFTLHVPPYRPDEWLDVAAPFALEPEGGQRCFVCYRLRLIKTLESLGVTGCDVFTTTLTVSPNKKAGVINSIGVEIAGGKFLAGDFKKKDGFKRSNELAKKWGLYRQDYCGCQYSRIQKPHPSSYDNGQ